MRKSASRAAAGSNVDFFSSVDAFKGPIDIGNANGNFGVRLGVNAAVPILPAWAWASRPEPRR